LQHRRKRHNLTLSTLAEQLDLEQELGTFKNVVATKAERESIRVYLCSSVVKALCAFAPCRLCIKNGSVTSVAPMWKVLPPA